MTRDETAGPTVLARSGGGAWVEPEQRGYLGEFDLQAMLLAQPSLIDGISSDAIAVREFATGIGPADLVVVDTTGALTVIECKLATNSDIRREIVGQVLDYASRLAETSPAAFADRWSARGGPSLDLFFDQRPGARERFEGDLNAGVFTLVLAVDRISVDLRRIVRYLNERTTAGMRLLAVELNRLTFGDTEVLVPTAYGAESADDKDARSGTPRRRWTAQDVDPTLRADDAPLADAVLAFVEDMETAGLRVQGGGTAAYPSFSLWGRTPTGDDVAPFSIFCGPRPTLSCNFGWSLKAGDVALRRFLDALIASGLPLARDEIIAADFAKRPSVPLSALKDASVRAGILSAAGHLRT